MQSELKQSQLYWLPLTVMKTEEGHKSEASTSNVQAPTTDKQAEQSLKAPRELRAWQAWFTALCIPIFLAMFTSSMLGLYVLTGK